MKTKSGFEYEIDPGMLDDWELIEEMQEMVDGGDPMKSIPIFKKILGADQYQVLKEYLRKKDGKVKTSAMIEEFNDILSGDAVKKSNP